MMTKILFNSLMIILLLAAVFILPIFYPAGVAVYLRLLLLLLILVAGFQLFKTLFIDRQVSETIANAATVFFSLFVIFILLEAIFMFIPRSHSADYTLASKLWYAKYWKPVNSLGFRDQEPDNKHPVILFVGDSFTAGHGLKSVRERFSNIVGEELNHGYEPQGKPWTLIPPQGAGYYTLRLWRDCSTYKFQYTSFLKFESHNKKPQKYTIVNIGRPNLDSRGEYETMMNFLYLTRIKPAKIILQYCGNDVEGVAAGNGLIFDGFRPPEDMHKFTVLIGAGSYVFNYLYFLFPREYLGSSYINYLTGAYKNDKVLTKHKEDLMLFVDYARDNSIQLVVVIFPFLADIPMSQSLYVNDIAGFFQAHQVSVINVAELAEKMPVEDRVVNKNDTHASAKLNKMIAREILNRLD